MLGKTSTDNGLLENMDYSSDRYKKYWVCEAIGNVYIIDVLESHPAFEMTMTLYEVL